MEKKYWYITPDDFERAAKNGINRNTFYSRIKLGWSAEKAATTPTGKKGRPRKEK